MQKLFFYNKCFNAFEKLKKKNCLLSKSITITYFFVPSAYK